jgi:hypothetical protein
LHGTITVVTAVDVDIITAAAAAAVIVVVANVCPPAALPQLS